jgi:hypothetical protein
MTIQVAVHTIFCDTLCHDIEQNYPYYDFVILNFQNKNICNSF